MQINTATNGMPAGADLSAADQRAVRVDANGRLLPFTAALLVGSGLIFKGFIPKNTAVNALGKKQGFVGPGGCVDAIAGAALTRGTHQELTLDDEGRVIPATPGTIVVAVWDGENHIGTGITAGGEVRVTVVAPRPFSENGVASGSGTIAGAADNAVIAVGAQYNGRPAVVTLQSDDATATRIVGAVVAAGNLTVTANAAATADTDFTYVIA